MESAYTQIDYSDFPAAYFLSKFLLQMAAHILSVQLWRQNKEIVH